MVAIAIVDLERHAHDRTVRVQLDDVPHVDAAHQLPPRFERGDKRAGRKAANGNGTAALRGPIAHRRTVGVGVTGVAGVFETQQFLVSFVSAAVE